MEENEKEKKMTDEQAALHPDYPAEIVALVRKGLTPIALEDAVLSYHENDIAAALGMLTPAERAKLYGIFDAETLSAVFEYVDETVLGGYFSELKLRKKVDILTNSESDVAVRYLRLLPKDERAALIEMLDNDDRRDIAMIGSFDEDEIGSVMTTNYVVIDRGLSVKAAMKELVAQAAEHDNISTIYVTDRRGEFYGAIVLKDLIIARESDTLDSVIVSSYPYVYGNELISDCIERIKEYSENSIPVLNTNNRLIGVVTATDIIQVVDDEMGEDYAKLAGLAAEEDIKEPLKKSIAKRLPWLAVLLGLGIVVSFVVGLFEHVVESLALIVCFQSLVLDMAGNVGTQSLAVTIRVLMDEQLTGKQRFALVLKETRVGLLNGLILGALSFGFIGLYILVFKGEPASTAFAISACTGVALLVSMLLSSLSGTTIPMLFKKLKVDPAVASGPLITTINDLVAVVTYYGLAWTLLINLLHIGG